MLMKEPSRQPTLGAPNSPVTNRRNNSPDAQTKEEENLDNITVGCSARITDKVSAEQQW
jgi:hypothetical protein